MKTYLLLAAALASTPTAFVLAATPNLAAPVAVATTSAEKPFYGPLQVSVDLPASLREASITDGIEQNVGEFVSEALRQQGFAGKIDYVSSGREAERNRPLLEVNLTEWRRDPTGSVNCTFTATISTAKGSQDLGLFSGTGMMMGSRGNWLARSNAFEDAIRSATVDLYQRVEKTNLL